MNIQCVIQEKALSLLHYFTGNNAKNIAKNGAIITASHIISSIKGIITGYFAIRFFSQNEYGSYRFILSILGVCNFLSLPGLPPVLSSHIAKKGKDSTLKSATWLYSTWCMSMSITILSSIVFLKTQGRMDLWPLLVLGALLFCPGNIGANIFGSIIQGTSQFAHSFLVTTISNIIQASFAIIMLFFYPSSMLLLLITMGIPALIYCGAIYLLLKQYPSKESAVPMIKNVLMLSISTIPTNLAFYIDGLLISYYFGLKQLALLSVTFLLPDQIKLWIKEIAPIGYAINARAILSRSYQWKITKLALLGIFLLIIICSVYGLLAPIFIPFLFPHYDTSLLFFSSIAIWTLIPVPLNVYTQFLEAQGHISLLQYISWTAAIFYIIVLVTLIPSYGILGAIIARGSFRGISGILSMIFFFRLKKKE